MSETKRQIKCGVCHEVGHNKKTCPTTKTTSEPSKEVSDVRKIVVVRVTEFYNDHVHAPRIYLCATAESAARKIAIILEGERYDGFDEDDDARYDAEIPRAYKDIFYYTPKESAKDIPNPTEQDIKKSLADPKNYDGLLIKIGEELQGATHFACEIHIEEKSLYM